MRPDGTPEDWGWCQPTWTRELLVTELERRGRPLVSVTTMGRALARLGASLKAAKPTVGCACHPPRQEGAQSHSPRAFWAWTAATKRNFARQAGERHFSTAACGETRPYLYRRGPTQEASGEMM